MLSSPPHAEADRTKQNAQISGETLQDHCPGQGLEGAFFAAPSAFRKKRKAQASAGQSSARGQHGCGADKGKSSVRVIRNSGIIA